MNNQGLDALAALAAAASHSSYPDVSNGGSNNSGGVDETKSDKKTSTETAAPAVPSTVNNNPSSALQQPPDMTVAHQQWQQVIANAAVASSLGAALSGGGPNNNNNLALFGSLQQQQQQQQLNSAAVSNPNILAIQQQLAMQQQLNYYQLLAHAATQQQRQFVGTTNPVVNAAAPNTATTTAAQAFSQVLGVPTSFSNISATSPVASGAVTGYSSPTTNLVSITNNKAVPLLNVPSTTVAPTVSGIGFPVPSVVQQQQPSASLTAIAPQPVKSRSSGTDWSDDDNIDDSEYYTGDKRQMKRVANRKSAQLSRKRKKQFIEELKEENDGLRRKEKILRSIPDLVVVFDSSGKLWFVSESVTRFLDYTAVELEGTSFWNRLCDDSVRLLKAAFMDSLAARQSDAETASLGSGTWELRLVDKDGSRKVVTLHGVVHFAGDRPECVCSIRPYEESSGNKRADNGIRQQLENFTSTSSTGSGTGSMKRHRKLSHVKPHQSVVVSSSETTTTTNDGHHHNSDGHSSSTTLRGSSANGGAVRISDSGHSSGSSDSGSGDELNTNEVTA